MSRLFAWIRNNDPADKLNNTFAPDRVKIVGFRRACRRSNCVPRFVCFRSSIGPMFVRSRYQFPRSAPISTTRAQPLGFLKPRVAGSSPAGGATFRAVRWYSPAPKPHTSCVCKGRGRERGRQEKIPAPNSCCPLCCVLSTVSSKDGT